MHKRIAGTPSLRAAAIVAVGVALASAAAPAASAAARAPIAGVAADSGSSSGSGNLLDAALNAICAITGEGPNCWGDVPH